MLWDFSSWTITFSTKNNSNLCRRLNNTARLTWPSKLHNLMPTPLTLLIMQTIRINKFSPKQVQDKWITTNNKISKAQQQHCFQVVTCKNLKTNKESLCNSSKIYHNKISKFSFPRTCLHSLKVCNKLTFRSKVASKSFLISLQLGFPLPNLTKSALQSYPINNLSQQIKKSHKMPKQLSKK